jgi:phosphinothricin acetyltransferase
MDDVCIRSAALSDAERLLEIYAWYVEHTAVSFEYDVPSLAAFRERMEQTLRRWPYLVAERGGRVLGYAYAGPYAARAAYAWSCELSVYLDRAERGRGLGRRLYETLEAALAEMGVQNLYACIAWPEREDEYLTRDSARFHARLGFAEAGHFHRCGCKFGRWYDVVWMEKLIGEHGGDLSPVRFRDGSRRDGG